MTHTFVAPCNPGYVPKSFPYYYINWLNHKTGDHFYTSTDSNNWYKSYVMIVDEAIFKIITIIGTG